MMNNSIQLRTVVLQKRSKYSGFGIYVADDIPSGLYIVTIDSESPAAEAGIQPGDRIHAINGRWLSSISTDPKSHLIELARNVDTLSLTVQSSYLLETAESLIPRRGEMLVVSHYDYHFHEYPSVIVSSTAVRRHRSHRHHRHYCNRQTQTSYDEEEERKSLPSSTPIRSVPSMGTSHAIRRRIRTSTKSCENDGKQEDAHAVDSRRQTDKTKENDRSSLKTIDDKLRRVRLHRFPKFIGFGVHIEYNKKYYRIQRIEKNSPAEAANLRLNDVILRVNDCSTEHMEHDHFVQLIQKSDEIDLLVQELQIYLRTHPDLSIQSPKPSVNKPSRAKEVEKPKLTLLRAFNSLMRRG